MSERRARGGPPEDSRAMRIVVAIAVEVGILAVVLQGGVEATVAGAALVLAPAGYVFSYTRRRRSGIVIKVILAVGLLLALDWFIGRVRFATTIDQARIPLASLFLWVQVLHSFDVPRRRDLAFSMVSSTTLIAAAGAIALTTSFVWILLVWAALAAAWLWLSARPPATELTPVLSVRRVAPDRRPRAATLRSVGVTMVAAAILASALFMAMPRVSTSLIRTPPFHLGPRAGTPADPGRSVTNPGLQQAGVDGVVDFSPDAYPGFGDAMDLRARGQLSDDIVFRVRADQPALWRAQAFDDFDGTTWTVSDPAWSPLELSPDAGSFRVDPARGDLPGLRRDTVVQTFYLDSQQPNVLFAAARPVTVYFPSGGLQDNEQGTIRAPILLDPGTVYSVESSLPIEDPATLRMIPRADPSDPVIGPFLQLPDELPHRDRALARRITSGAATQYDAVQAVQGWLRTNTRYDLTVPREPDGVDAVDWFLFQTRRGFCEHIASAMVVLLRASGIPARIVTGYAPGDRNPFTGYFEVRQSDAHAWVEVWYPDVGWVPYDPTFGVPLADMSWGSFVGQDVLAAVARVIGEVVPPSVRRAIASSLHTVAGAVGRVGGAWPVPLIAIATLAAIWVARRRRGPRSERPPDEIGRAYEDLLDVLGRAGLTREPSDTPAEVLARAQEDLATPRELVRSAAVVVRTFERARYAPAHERPGPDEVVRARAEAARARALGPRRPAVTSRDVPEHQAPS